MEEISNEALIKKARGVARLKRIAKDVEIGDVGCALVTDRGNVYLGRSIIADCSVGFCAEHAAISDMLTHNEYNVSKIVAVSKRGVVLPPCGRCREFLYQITKQNGNVRVVVSKNKMVRLKTLLPNPWQEKW